MRRLVVSVAALLASRVAFAAPLAKLDADLDGNGTPGSIEIDATGTLRITQSRTVALPVSGPVEAAHLDFVRPHGQPLILVELTTATASEAVIVELGRNGRWEVAQRFPIGGVGLDKDYAINVDATPEGIYSYQVRGDIRRCDGKPTYLFPQGYVPGQKIFARVVPPSAVDETAKALQARVDSTTAAAPLIYRARVASTQPGAADAGSLTIPAELDDGRLDTAWREELGTDGHGQFFTFEPRVGDVAATQLRIVPGAQASDADLKAHNRVRGFAIATAQGSWLVELPDAGTAALRTAYVVDLPTPVTGCVSVVLLSTYPSKGNQTTIPELEVFAEGERSGGGDPMLAHVIAGGKTGVTAATEALAKRGAIGVAAIDAELAKTTDAGARRRLIKALVKIPDPASAALLARAAAEGWVGEQDLIDVIGALARNGQAQELHDLAATGGVALEARVAAAKGLAPTGTALPLLVDLAGHGPRELRSAVLDRLAGAPVAMLSQAALAQSLSAAAGDLWRAVTKRARASIDERATAMAAMRAALPSADDYERRYRLIDGLATYGDAAALQAIEALLRGLPAGGQASALRQVAIHAVGSAPRLESIGLVIDFARDPDPGVRLAVLGVLEGAEADPAGPWHTSAGPDGIDRVIITALSTDTWPEVRRRAATALGGRCQRTGPAKALEDAVARDRTLEVRGDALTALVQCHAAGAAELLSRTWDNGKLPVALRAHAVDLAVALEDPRLGVRLVERFATWRGASLESAEALALAQSAAAAIGRMRAAGAAQALLPALDDTAFPEIVAAAALGLGALGPACPPAAATKLALLARGGEQFAIAARIAARQCGH
jgi:hypothetical protein